MALGRWLLGFCTVLLLPTAIGGQNFVVGVEQTAYFPIYETRGDDWVGFSRELLDAFAASKGYAFTYRVLPIKRLFADFLGNDELDFKYPDHPLWQSELKKGVQIRYSRPVFESIEGGLVLPQNVGHPIGEVRSLGTIRGFTPWPYIDALNNHSMNLEESDDLAVLVQMALFGRVDAVFVNVDIVDYHLNHVLKKPGALVLDPGLPNNTVAYLVASRRHPEVITELDVFLAAESVLIAEMRKKNQLE